MVAIGRDYAYREHVIRVRGHMDHAHADVYGRRLGLWRRLHTAGAYTPESALLQAKSWVDYSIARLAEMEAESALARMRARLADREYPRVVPTATPIYFVDENPVPRAGVVALAVAGLAAVAAAAWALWPKSGAAAPKVSGSLAFSAGERYEVDYSMPQPIPTPPRNAAPIALTKVAQSALDASAPGTFSVASVDATDRAAPRVTVDCLKSSDLSASPSALSGAFDKLYPSPPAAPSVSVADLGPTPKPGQPPPPLPAHHLPPPPPPVVPGSGPRLVVSQADTGRLFQVSVNETFEVDYSPPAGQLAWVTANDDVFGLATMPGEDNSTGQPYVPIQNGSVRLVAVSPTPAAVTNVGVTLTVIHVDPVSGASSVAFTFGIVAVAGPGHL